jgi:hypothetical protein
MGLIFFRGWPWQHTAETIAIVVVEVLMAFFVQSESCSGGCFGTFRIRLSKDKARVYKATCMWGFWMWSYAKIVGMWGAPGSNV